MLVPHALLRTKFRTAIYPPAISRRAMRCFTKNWRAAECPLPSLAVRAARDRVSAFGTRHPSAAAAKSDHLYMNSIIVRHRHAGRFELMPASRSAHTPQLPLTDFLSSEYVSAIEATYIRRSQRKLPRFQNDFVIRERRRPPDRRRASFHWLCSTAMARTERHLYQPAADPRDATPFTGYRFRRGWTLRRCRDRAAIESCKRQGDLHL